jgi:hypothetical protein
MCHHITLNKQFLYSYELAAYVDKILVGEFTISLILGKMLYLLILKILHYLQLKTLSYINLRDISLNR